MEKECIYVYKEILINLKIAHSNAVVDENRHGAIKTEILIKNARRFLLFFLFSHTFLRFP